MGLYVNVFVLAFFFLESGQNGRWEDTDLLELSAWSYWWWWVWGFKKLIRKKVVFSEKLLSFTIFPKAVDRSHFFRESCMPFPRDAQPTTLCHSLSYSTLLGHFLMWMTSLPSFIFKEIRSLKWMDKHLVTILLKTLFQAWYLRLSGNVILCPR